MLQLQSDRRRTGPTQYPSGVGYANQPRVGAANSGAFLEFFQARGCYLEDLSHEPLNALGPADRAAARAQCVPKLARRLRPTHPKTIICVMQGVREEVQRAVALAGLSNVEFFSVPFPAQGHQRQYEDGLITILRRCKRRGLLGRAELV